MDIGWIISGATVATGMTFSGIWSMTAWRFRYIKNDLAENGYDSAHREVWAMTWMLIPFWMIIVPFWLILTIYASLMRISNPHLEHRKSWERKLALRSMEQDEYPDEGTISLVPECACQIDPGDEKGMKNPYLSNMMSDDLTIKLLLQQRTALKDEIKRLRSIGLT